MSSSFLAQGDGERFQDSYVGSAARLSELELTTLGEPKQVEQTHLP